MKGFQKVVRLRLQAQEPQVVFGSVDQQHGGGADAAVIMGAAQGVHSLLAPVLPELQLRVWVGETVLPNVIGIHKGQLGATWTSAPAAREGGVDDEGR